MNKIYVRYEQVFFSFVFALGIPIVIFNYHAGMSYILSLIAGIAYFMVYNYNKDKLTKEKK